MRQLFPLSRGGVLVGTAALLLLLAMALGQTARGDSIRPTTTPYRTSATGSGNSYSPVFSADGQNVAFVAHANNLVTNDDAGFYLDLFLRNLPAGKTVLISINTNGVGGANDDVRAVAVSSDAQIIAFETAANNLAPGDENWMTDVYVRDRTLGATRLVSVAADGASAGNERSFNPLISADGRYVIFESLASNLVTNDFNGTNDIFLRDLTSGVTSLVSVNSDGLASGAGASHSASISADGRRIAFVSYATNLVAGVTNRWGEVYVRDVATASTRWAVASHIGSTWTRSPASGMPVSYRAFDPVLTPDGHYVAFKTETATVRLDLERPVETIERVFTNGFVRTYFRFDDNPRVSRAATAVPLNFAAEGRLLFFEAPTNYPPILPTGAGGIVRVDFETLQTNSVLTPCPGCQPGSYTTNVFPSSELVITNVPWQSGLRWSRLNWLVPSVDGAMLCLLGNVTNYTPGEPVVIGTRQIYACDYATRQIHLVSTNRSGQPGPDLGDVVPSVDAGVSRLAWETLDPNMVGDDLNRAWDVFVRDLTDGSTKLISATEPGLPTGVGFGMTVNPISLSANGRRIAFVSTDSSLVANDTNRLHDIFVLDLTNPALPPLSSLSLRPVGVPIGMNALDMAASPVLSADGRYLAFARVTESFLSTNRSIYWADLSIPTNRLVSSQGLAQTLISPPVMTPDGGLVAYSSMDSSMVSDVNNQPDVFVAATRSVPGTVGFPGGSATISVSTIPNGLATGNGASIEPAFSPDGSWIVFRSSAKDLISEGPVESLDHQLYARGLGCNDAACLTNLASAGYLGPTRLLSYEVAGVPPRNVPLAKGAIVPAFSGDSRWIAFASGAGVIYRHDLHSGLTVDATEQNGVAVTNRYRPPNLRVCEGCGAPSLNADGTLISYELRVGGATNVHCKNLTTDADELISVNRDGTGGGNGRSFGPMLSQNGRFVVFASQASNLIANDNNRASDIFVRDRWNQLTHCLSRNWQGTATGNGVSSHPVLSADGRTVAFQSFANDLVPGDYNETRDVFVVVLAGPDTDADGLDDELELAYFNTLSRDGSGDFDNDGLSDAVEIRSGTNPADRGSVLGVTAISAGLAWDGGIVSWVTYVTWRAVPGHRYRVQHRPDLSPGTWQDLPGEVVTQGAIGSFTHVSPLGPGLVRGFYRVKQVD